MASNQSSETLHTRYQLALRGSHAMGESADPGDALSLWSRVVDDMSFAVVCLREGGVPLRGEARVMLVGGIGEQLDVAHRSILKLHSWTRQIHRTLDTDEGGRMKDEKGSPDPVQPSSFILQP